MAGCERVVEFLQTWMKRGVADTALHEAKRLLLNQLKASIAAAAEPSLQAAHEIATAAWTPSRPVAGSAQVLWYGTRNTPAQAALVNAMAFDLLDLGATCIAAPRPAVASVLAAVLAQAEAGAHDGRDALTALVLGIEVQLACDTANTAANAAASAATSAAAPAGLGAAAACAVLGGLSPERMREALDLAAVMGPRATDTPRDAVGSGYSAHLTGLAARAGVEACRLAERGLRVPPSSRLQWADDGLDAFADRGAAEESWRLFDHAFHTLPASVPVHAVVDGVLALLPLAAGRTPRRLQLHVAPAGAVGDSHDAIVALQDMRLCAAAAWRRGRFSAAQMLAPGFFDAATCALADRIEVIADARRERLDGCSLEAEFGDGSTASVAVEHYLGSPGRPLSDPQLSELFREVSEDRLPPEQAGRILQAVWALDAAPDIHSLIALLRGPGH